jgi:hypothetical protein
MVQDATHTRTPEAVNACEAHFGAHACVHDRQLSKSIARIPICACRIRIRVRNAGACWYYDDVVRARCLVERGVTNIYPLL